MLKYLIVRIISLKDWPDVFPFFCRFEAQHGLLCALGYVTANCMLRNPPVSSFLLRVLRDRHSFHLPYLNCEYIFSYIGVTS